MLTDPTGSDLTRSGSQLYRTAGYRTEAGGIYHATFSPMAMDHNTYGLLLLALVAFFIYQHARIRHLEREREKYQDED